MNGRRTLGNKSCVKRTQKNVVFFIPKTNEYHGSNEDNAGFEIYPSVCVTIACHCGHRLLTKVRLVVSKIFLAVSYA